MSLKISSGQNRISREQQKTQLFVALELVQATWVVALHSPIADKISVYRIEGGDTHKLTMAAATVETTSSGSIKASIMT